MNEQIDSLSISSQIKPINQDIIVEYTPNSNVISYNYTLYKDEVIIDTYNSANDKTSIIMDESGVYQIIINETDIYGNINQITSGIYNVDKEKPNLEINQYSKTIKIGEKFDFMAGIKATDNISGDISSKVTTNYNELDFRSKGIKELVYSVSDEAGNITTKTVNINVISNFSDPLLYIQMGIGIVLLIFAFLLFYFRRSVKLEKRISKFSIRSAEDNSNALFDSFAKTYQKLISKISKIIEKSVFVKKYSKKFEKYLSVSNNLHNNSVDFVSSKIIFSFLFLIIAIISKALQSKIISTYEMVIPFIAGFFVLDIIYFFKYKMFRKRIENDLLQAIIIMNNAFKSGRSITQAIELVTTELDGPIAGEFGQMINELSLGLSIDVVFERFSQRVNLEEVTYLTASLSILNKTGGNIIKVFTSIEKSMFNKRKLRLEMQALTGSSRLIVYVLFLVPVFFIVLVALINPSYFEPFFTNPIGTVLLVFMILYYIIYVILVNKMMKVRMWNHA